MSVRVTNAEVEKFKIRYAPRQGQWAWPEFATAYRIARDLLEAREALRQIGGPIAEAALERTK